MNTASLQLQRRPPTRLTPILCATMTIVMSGCGLLNRAPVITHEITAKDQLRREGPASVIITLLSVEAADPNGDPITYAWSVSTGNVLAHGATAEWRGAQTGSSARVTVTDPRGKSAASVFVQKDRAPVLADTISFSDHIEYDSHHRAIGVVSKLSIDALDPDGGALSGQWTVSSGEVRPAGLSADWIGARSGASAHVVVSNPRGRSASRDFSVPDRPPVLGETIAYADRIGYKEDNTPAGIVTKLSIDAFDPNGDTPSCSWSVSTGEVRPSGLTADWVGAKAGATARVVVSNSRGQSATKDFALPERPPVVADAIVFSDRIIYDDQNKATGVVTKLSIDAFSPQGDALSYHWTVSAGTVRADGPVADWVDARTGASVRVEVSNSQGQTVARELLLPSRPLVVADTIAFSDSIALDGQNRPKGIASHLSIDAFDPDGATLSYEWTVSSGELNAAGRLAHWTGAPTGASARVEISNEHGASATRELTVPERPPVLEMSFEQHPKFENHGQLVDIPIAITAQAYDPQDGPLTFEWAVTAGSIEGDGARATWTKAERGASVKLTAVNSRKMRTELIRQLPNRPPIIAGALVKATIERWEREIDPEYPRRFGPAVHTWKKVSLESYASDDLDAPIDGSIEEGGVVDVSIVLDVTDPDGDRLTAEWSATSGTIDARGQWGAQWAPGSAYSNGGSITVKISDGRGAETEWTLKVKGAEGWR